MYDLFDRCKLAVRIAIIRKPNGPYGGNGITCILDYN
jgi:hypothetical protein